MDPFSNIVFAGWSRILPYANTFHWYYGTTGGQVSPIVTLDDMSKALFWAEAKAPGLGEGINSGD